MDAAAVENELRNLDNRARSIHRRMGEVQVKQADADRELGELRTEVHTEVANIKDDIAEVKKTVEREGESNRQSNNRLLMALVGFALTAAGSAITIAITIGGSAG